MNAPTKVNSPQLSIRREFEATPSEVFTAFSKAEALAQWFAPHGGPARARTDLRVDGEWSLEMPGSDGATVSVSGRYLEIIENRRLAFTWAWAGTPDRISKVCIDLADREGKTLLTLTHTQFYDEDARDNHAKGWAACLDQLGVFLTVSAQAEVSS